MPLSELPNADAGPICIIAGQGVLPAAVAEGCHQQGRSVVVAQMEGTQPELPANLKRVVFRLERLGGMLNLLRQMGVSDVVMAGALHRPNLDWTKLDARTLALVPKIMRAMGAGDDGAVRGAIAVFEAAGFRVRGAHEFVPDFLVTAGPVAGPPPTDGQLKDTARGQAILETLGPLDVAQACVVAGGQCLGIETIYGTDALLADVAWHRDERRPQEGGVLIKRPKPGQELRVDMPVIGPDTVRNAAAARLDAIHLAADQLMILDAPNVVTEADRLGVRIWAE